MESSPANAGLLFFDAHLSASWISRIFGFFPAATIVGTNSVPPKADKTNYK